MRQKILRYAMLTVLSAIVLYGSAIGLRELLHTTEEFAYGFALAAVFVMNFLIMRQHVFEAHEGDPWRQAGRYVVSVASFRALEYLAFLVLHTWLGLWYVLAMLIISAVGTVAKFFVYGNFVFAEPKRDPAEAS